MAKPQLGPQLPFGPYTPDLPDLGGGARTAENCIPHVKGYEPFPDVTEYSTTGLQARCQGAFSCQDADGVVYSFASDATKHYLASGTSWGDVTGSTTMSVPTDGQTRYALFGSTVITVNGSSAPQKWTLGSSTTFADLSGSPPTGEDVAVINNFVVMLNGNTLTNSGLNNAEGWTAGTNQSDTSPVVGEGSLGQRIIGGDFGILLAKGAIYRVDYAGAPTIFNVQRIKEGRGCLAKNAVCKRESIVYFLSDDGFYATDGVQCLPIGKDKIDNRFLSMVDPAYYDRIWMVADPFKPLIIVGAPVSGNIGGLINRLFVYLITTGQWSEVDLTQSTATEGLEILWRDMSKGYTLDELDVPMPSIDGPPQISFDSAKWQGGVVSLAAFNGDHKEALFTGDNLAATIDTMEAQLNPGMETLVTALRPIVDTDAVTAKLGYRKRQSDSVTWSDAATLEDNGDLPFDVESAVYQRARMIIAAGATWTVGQGFDAQADENGMP